MERNARLVGRSCRGTVKQLLDLSLTTFRRNPWQSRRGAKGNSSVFALECQTLMWRTMDAELPGVDDAEPPTEVFGHLVLSTHLCLGFPGRFLSVLIVLVSRKLYISVWRKLSLEAFILGLEDLNMAKGG